MRHLIRRSAVAAFVAGLSLPAQEMVGVDWSGQVVLVDSQTGAAVPFATGFVGQNTLGRDAAGNLWSTARTGAGPYTYHYTSIDVNTGSVAIRHSGVPEVRGLSSDGAGQLFGIREQAVDELVRIDMVAGTTTTIGSTGRTGIQALALHQGVLYAWDITFGLLVLDQMTGLATDPFPLVGGALGLQFLCSHPDGRLLAGGGSSTNTLFWVDVTTGAANYVGMMVGAVDLRGLELRGGYGLSMGNFGCNGASGQVSLSLSGSLRANGTFVATSTNHAPNTLGATILGLSRTSNQGQALPMALDPLLGTAGCVLFVSIDAVLFGTTSATAPAVLQFTAPLGPAYANAVFYVQHVCFEPVPGGLSWSNGVTAYIDP